MGVPLRSSREEQMGGDAMCGKRIWEEREKEKENARRDRGLSAFLKKGEKEREMGRRVPVSFVGKVVGREAPNKFREFPLGRKRGCDDSLLSWSEVVGGLCRFRLCWNSDLFFGLFKYVSSPPSHNSISLFPLKPISLFHFPPFRAIQARNNTGTSKMESFIRLFLFF